MEEVYVIARHNFHHFRAKQEKFAPVKILNDSTVLPKANAFLSQQNGLFQVAILTDAQRQLPNSPPVLGAHWKHKLQSLRSTGSNPLEKYEKLK